MSELPKVRSTHSHPDLECTVCPLGDAMARRRFLHAAAVRALGAIGALTLMSNSAAAMSVTFVSGSGKRADRSYPIPALDGVAIDREESVIIARFDNRAYAFSLACPHQNTALRWEEKARRFQCPKHKSRYQPTGAFIEGRATRGMDRFAIKRDGGNLAVDLDTLYREDRHPAEWAAAVVSLEAEK